MNFYASSRWLDSFENRNFKWLDNATINWAEGHISPIRYTTERVIHELYNSYKNNRPATFDEEPEPASDAELKELLGIK